MRLRRDEFIGQFWPGFKVHSLKLWRRGSKEPPDHLPRSLYEQIETSNGTISIKLQDFRPIAMPVVVEFHRKGKGARPDAHELAGALYDALKAAGVEVTIGPPAQSSRSR